MTIGTAKPILAQTAIVGGPSVPFDDAREVASWPAKLEIAQDFPITGITVRHGWIINNLTIIYRTVNGNSATVSHGGDSGGIVDKVALNENEIITSVQGRAGQHRSYNRPYLCSISFTILDTKTLVTRTTNIFGNGDGTNQGDPFQVAQPYAFAGATYTDGQTGVAGLSFFKVITNA
uniref:Lectin n=1 Tax=Hygrophorus russula TaxID=264141 RepID=G3XEW4_9AGAR|nr:lectin [Hygrophorus russula]